MNLLSVRREVGEFKKRYKWFALVVVCVFLLLFGRIIQLQVVDYDHYAQIARENITRIEIEPATRGNIYDMAGRTIAEDRQSFAVYLTPQYLRESDPDTIAGLMMLDVAGRRRLQDRLAAVPARQRAHQVRTFTNITREQLAALETHEQELCARTGNRNHPLRLPCIQIVVEPARYYAFGSLGAHAIGYLNEAYSAEPTPRDYPDQRHFEEAHRNWRTEQERLERAGYRAGELAGRTGVERAWESYLRGHRGYRRVWVDSRDRQMDSSTAEAGQPMHRDAVPGRNLTLTLDMDLMRTIDRAFSGYPSGAAVVVDVHTGAVRALYSKPSFDLAAFTRGMTGAEYTELLTNPFHPLIDKTIYETNFPGSIFKPFTALAGLEAGLLDPAATENCVMRYQVGTSEFLCNSAHGDVDFREAMVRSCNVYFWQLARRVGLDRIARMAGDFGLGRRTGVGINAESPGLVPTRAFYEERGLRFLEGYAMITAIGQGETRLTPIQLAMAYAAIANGGTLYVPQLVSRVTGPGDPPQVIEEFQPRVRRRVHIEQEHLARVVEALYGVVNDPAGTAYNARIEGGVPVAGKTGTAELEARIRPGTTAVSRRPRARSHAWFAGFAPAGNPEVAIVVFVEHGGAGGQFAAPVAVRILQEYLSPRVGSAQNETPATSTLTRTH